jgi:hypothetical protein
MGMGTKEDESSIGCVWTAGFHHVTAHSCLAHVLKLMNFFFFNFFKWGGGGKPWITETVGTESVDMGAQLYSVNDCAPNPWM